MARPPCEPEKMLRQLADLMIIHGDLSQTEFEQLKNRDYGKDSYYRHFGSWRNAKRLARELLASEGKELSEEKNYRLQCEQLERECQRLQSQVQKLRTERRFHYHDFFDRKVLIGLITDTQVGSLYENPGIVELAYDTFQYEGVENVYHAGDFVDGEKMYRGHEYEIRLHGHDAQMNAVVNDYPRRDGITTHFITGNHDLSFWKHAGIDIGDKIAERRSDLKYLGREEQTVIIGKEEESIKLQLVHPGYGTAYALSYHPQKYIEALPGGKKPHIIVMGHTHKAEMIPSYRNVCLIQGGCTQSQTGFMKRKSLAAHLGFWIVEFTINPPHRMSRFKSEFFAVFEEQD